MRKLTRGRKELLGKGGFICTNQLLMENYMPVESKMVFDIHAHASLKGYVFGNDLTHRHSHPLPDFYTLDAQIDLPDMNEGGVQLMMCAHYLIEREFISHWSPTLRFLSDFYQWIEQRGLVEDSAQPGHAFNQMLGIMAHFEKALVKANTKGFACCVAKNLMEARLGILQGKTVFLHGIEGTNCFNNLGEDLPLVKAVSLLKSAGVAQVTLAHLVDSELVPSQQMIPPGTKKELGYTGADPDPDATLNTKGEELVTALMDAGILIDLQHCTPATRRQVYAINKQRDDKKTPLLFSHTGLRSIAVQGKMGEMSQGKYTYQCDLDNLPTDEEVVEIIRSGGVIGVIFANYWLCGTEEDSLAEENGIPWVIKTIKAIAALEKTENASFDYEHICIGSDMDGFTQRPDDLTSPRNMNDLREALFAAGLNDTQVQNILWRNYMRVLERGWK